MEQSWSNTGEANWAAITPHRFKLPRRYYFTSISAGQYNTCGISNTQQVYCWGENWNYQVGIGTGSTSDVTTPALVNLGPSTQNGPQQYPLIHDRDPDNDGILSIFDDTPLAPDCLAGTYFILQIETCGYSLTRSLRPRHAAQ